MRVYRRNSKLCTEKCSDKKPCQYCVFYADLRDIGLNRKKIGRGPNGKTLAEADIRKRQSLMDEGRTCLDIKRETPITLIEFFENEFEPEHIKKRRSCRVYTSLTKPLKEQLGTMNMHEITTSRIERYKNENEQRGYVVINRELSLLRTAFNVGTEWNKKRMEEKKTPWELPLINPVNGVRFFPEKSRNRYGETEELKKLIENSSYERLRDFILLALNTLMRKGEIQALDVEKDTDFIHNVIILRENKTAHLKDTQEEQVIPMNQIVRAICRKYRSKGIAKPFDFNPRKAFATALTKSGIENLHIHDLRRTGATLLYKLGVQPYTISKILRHTDPNLKGVPKTTMIYTHVLPQELHEAVTKLEEYFYSQVIGTALAQMIKSILSDEDLKIVNPMPKVSYR